MSWTGNGDEDETRTQNSTLQHQKDMQIHADSQICFQHKGKPAMASFLRFVLQSYMLGKDVITQAQYPLESACQFCIQRIAACESVKQGTARHPETPGSSL